MSQFDPDIKTCWTDQVVVGFGITMFVCFSRKFVGPIGLVWGILAKSGKRRRFDVVHSYVPPWARRKGVRTLINREILKSCDVITTMEGSDEGGTAFLRRFGYVHERKKLQWTYMRQKPSRTSGAAPRKRKGR